MTTPEESHQWHWLAHVCRRPSARRMMLQRSDRQQPLQPPSLPPSQQQWWLTACSGLPTWHPRQSSPSSCARPAKHSTSQDQQVETNNTFFLMAVAGSTRQIPGWQLLATIINAQGWTVNHRWARQRIDHSNTILCQQCVRKATQAPDDISRLSWVFGEAAAQSQNASASTLSAPAHDGGVIPAPNPTTCQGCIP